MFITITDRKTAIDLNNPLSANTEVKIKPTLQTDTSLENLVIILPEGFESKNLIGVLTTD